jgi:hypothetical protein
MKPILRTSEAQFVILGNFNPNSISLEMMLDGNLISENDGCTMTVPVASVTDDTNLRSIESSWFELNCYPQYIILTSKGLVTPLIKDLFVGILALQKHTEIIALGLNSIAHFDMIKEENLQRFREKIAPGKVWHSILGENACELEEMTLVITETNASTAQELGRIKRLTITTSDQFQAGLQFTLNQHFPVIADNRLIDATHPDWVAIVNQHWQSSINEAAGLFEKVMESIMSV